MGLKCKLHTVAQLVCNVFSRQSARFLGNCTLHTPITKKTSAFSRANVQLRRKLAEIQQISLHISRAIVCIFARLEMK